MTVESSTSFDDGWSQWEQIDEEGETSVEPPAGLVVETLPPQLHPAVSLGMKRMSSCYFSAGSVGSSQQGSVADLLSLLEESSIPAQSRETSSLASTAVPPTGDLLYHDILMNVFTFLDAKSLASFSETARRPNFEVFYFLQLQLQRALLPSNTNNYGRQLSETTTTSHHDDTLSAISGVGIISRLNDLDHDQAEKCVQDFLDSNSTLRTMPLSHSLAYFRQWLLRHGNQSSFLFGSSEDGNNLPAQQQAIASAALLMTVLGAACAGVQGSTMMQEFSFGSELPNMLFKVGFVGSLMGAARKMSETDGGSMRERAETLGRTMQEMSNQLMKQMRASATNNLNFVSRNLNTETNTTKDAISTRKSAETMSSTSVESCNSHRQLDPSPYGHGDEEEKTDGDAKVPSGCVGAYLEVVRRANHAVMSTMKQQRREKYSSLSEREKRQVSRAFIDACCSDESFPLVKDIVQKRQVVDVEGMYCGSDGTETCALHTSAFHGSNKILEFLCRGVDENDPSKDGGLCDVNRKDDNGWTAMHFAAGANSVEAVCILARCGAELDLEAVNGYTPLQWALRLQNKEAADELQRLANELESRHGWMSRKPLSMLANRFFALIPSH